MYVSKRNNGFSKSALIISIVGMLLSLGLCLCMFMKIAELENRLEGYDELKLEYRVLSERISEYAGKSGEYLDELDMRIDMLESVGNGQSEDALMKDATASAVTVETSTTPLPDEDIKEQETSVVEPATTESFDISKTEGKGKKVYLTFDDGPSANTNEILDILNSYGAKATFFVNGKKESLYADYYQRIVDEGHTIAMHSYTHAYSEIYSSVDAFMADMVRLRDYIERLTGAVPDIYRFPGGSSNTITQIDILEFGRALAAEGIVYFDWNVSSNDASSVLKTAEEIYNSVISGVKKKDTPVVLMHDLQSKITTVEALPMILDYLLNNGYEVVALDSSVEPVQHVRLDK